MATIHTRVSLRNNFGQFISRMEADAVASVEDIAQEGADAAESAYHGSGLGVRSGETISSIHGHAVGRDAIWSAHGPGVTFHEEGSVAHPIYGHPFLAWPGDRGDRATKLGSAEKPAVVSHPGAPARHWLLTSYAEIATLAMTIARRHYG